MLKLLVGLLLLPASVSSLLAAGKAFGGVATAARATWPFLAGFFGYPLLAFAVFRPVRLYVFGHELTHAFAAWMSGASVLRFFVGRKGGHVDLTDSNAFIALAPYIVPIYAVVVIVSYRLLLWAVPLEAEAAHRVHAAFLLATGMSLSFHLIHTVETLWETHQPDLDQAGGVLFSISVVALLNGALLTLALKCLFPRSVAAGESMAMIGKHTFQFWRAAGAALGAGARQIARSRFWRGGSSGAPPAGAISSP